MPAAKRRKVTTVASKIYPSSAGITAFAKVSKSQLNSNFSQYKPVCSATTQLGEELYSDRKRKLLLVEEVDKAGDEASNIQHTAICQSPRDIKPLPERRLREHQSLSQTPKKPISAPSNLGSADTPTKGARALLCELALSSSSPQAFASPLLKPQDLFTIDDQLLCDEPLIKDQPTNPEEEKLPSELLDLINLHVSFLTALSLHHAHYGIHSPTDLRMLCPDVARAWGKRKITLEDIQRIIGVLNIPTSDNYHSDDEMVRRPSLSNYGHGKICVEVKTAIGRRGNAALPLDENRLNDAFARNLRRLWEHHKTYNGSSIATFVRNLPLETISTCSSLTKISPLLAKGQRRLEDLRGGITMKRQAQKERDATAHMKDDPSRKPTLLERLKAKELRQLTLPLPPSMAELSRNSALHRLEEVAAVLSLLTTSTSVGQKRVSFTMPTILGKLRDSFKTPMSKEEGEACVRLLASEIAPEWLKVVKMGKLDAVLVVRDHRPSDLDIRERVRRAT